MDISTSYYIKTLKKLKECLSSQQIINFIECKYDRTNLVQDICLKKLYEFDSNNFVDNIIKLIDKQININNNIEYLLNMFYQYSKHKKVYLMPILLPQFKEKKQDFYNQIINTMINISNKSKNKELILNIYNLLYKLDKNEIYNDIIKTFVNNDKTTVILNLLYFYKNNQEMRNNIINNCIATNNINCILNLLDFYKNDAQICQNIRSNFIKINKNNMLTLLQEYKIENETYNKILDIVANGLQTNIKDVYTECNSDKEICNDIIKYIVINKTFRIHTLYEYFQNKEENKEICEDIIKNIVEHKKNEIPQLIKNYKTNTTFCKQILQKHLDINIEYNEKLNRFNIKEIKTKIEIEIQYKKGKNLIDCINEFEQKMTDKQKEFLNKIHKITK